IKTSINIPVDEIENRSSSDLPDKSKEIVVYCASTDCQASPRAGKKLEELGYTNVVDYEAGIAGWQDAGYEFEEDAA
ncbi:MAG: rhodanese-like domain-containing protein, partial [Nanoarchaeota archaeon]|nr:rhodanese-like domain-containing protein [Nanoarchaeota archaeon]